MIAESALYDFPNQRRTLAALERVREICLAEGVTAKQAVAALEPIHPHWMPMDRRDANVARLIGALDTTPRVPDFQVRARLLAGLGPEDREGLFGMMDVGPYLTPANELEATDPTEYIAQPIASLRIQPAGLDNEFATEGWPSYLAYTFAEPRDEIASARWLILPVIAPMGDVEVWWDDGRDRWTEGRSVRWRIDADRPQGVVWAVPLDRLPHWDGRTVRRVHVAFRHPGTILSGPRGSHTGVKGDPTITAAAPAGGVAAWHRLDTPDRSGRPPSPGSRSARASRLRSGSRFTQPGGASPALDKLIELRVGLSAPIRLPSRRVLDRFLVNPDRRRPIEAAGTGWPPSSILGGNDARLGSSSSRLDRDRRLAAPRPGLALESLEGRATPQPHGHAHRPSRAPSRRGLGPRQADRHEQRRRGAEGSALVRDLRQHRQAPRPECGPGERHAARGREAC